MSSFAEQLAARAAKRTGGAGGESNSISSPSRRSGSENLNNHGSSCASSTGSSSSPSRTATSLSEQIKSRAVDKSNTNTNGGQMTEISQKSISSATTNTTVSTDETLSFKSSSSTNPQKLTQQPKQTKTLPIKIKQSSSSSSSRSKRSNEGNTNNLPVSSSSLQQQSSISRADINDNNDYDLLDGSDHMDEPTTSYIPAKLNQQHSTATKLRAKLEKYKSENKKLRHESLLLKAKLEEMATLLSQLESGHKVENDELKVRCRELSEKVLLLEMSSLNLPGGDDDDDEYEWNGIRSSIMKLREERTKQQQRRSSLTTTTTNNSKVGRTYMLSADTFAEMDKEDLVAENVRLTQLMLDMEGLDELQRLANAQNVRGREHDIINNEDEDEGKKANGTTSGDNDEKDAAITALNKKVSQIEEELTEVTDLKNAEIDVLRKQLNRVEQQQHNRNSHNSNNSNSPQDVAAINMEQQQQQWKKEREELREEIRRLNQEASRRMSNRLDQEEEEANARYNGTSSSATSSTSLFITSPKNLDKSDISSLQSIIGMMRQTIDQSNKEKEELEQRLAEEQERSQNELKAFAKTLEGVDDLRKSAETMSREIRRIKVKGYRPTRSDLMGGGGDLNGVRNFGELTAAVEASDCMEDAIRLIEGQNDALEERRRMGVVVASQSHGGSGAGAGGSGAAPIARRGVVGLRAISEDEDDDEGGFLSFWNGARRTNDDEDDSDAIAKREKKKKTKRKKKRGDEGSVFTSFF